MKAHPEVCAVLSLFVLALTHSPCLQVTKLTGHEPHRFRSSLTPADRSTRVRGMSKAVGGHGRVSGVDSDKTE